VGAIGGDDKAGLIREALLHRGVDLSYAPGRSAGSRYAVILVAAGTGERVVLWHREPSLALRPGDLPAEAIRRARLLHVDGVDEEVAIAAASIAREAGIPVTSDIDRVGSRTRDLVSAVTVPILAEHVPEALTGEADVERALRALRRSHPGWLCATRGARGAVLLAGDVLHEVAGHVVDVVDTTGAGDIFRGAFIYAMLRGDAPADVLRVANAAAAVSCTRLGAIASVPTLAEALSQSTLGDC
jgi:sugar/nucleoside kinase (ribokinase family)